MNLFYVTLRRKHTHPQSSFKKVICPAVLRTMKLPSNYKAIEKRDLIQALEDTYRRVEKATRTIHQVIIVTNATGPTDKIVEVLNRIPENLIVYIIAIEEVGNRNLVKLRPKIPRDLNVGLYAILSGDANQIISDLFGGNSRN